jgi:hypothetical protein
MADGDGLFEQNDAQVGERWRKRLQRSEIPRLVGIHHQCRVRGSSTNSLDYRAAACKYVVIFAPTLVQQRLPTVIRADRRFDRSSLRIDRSP